MDDTNQLDSGWHLHDNGWELRSPNRQRVLLSTSERSLLLALAAQPGRVVSRLVLSQAIARENSPSGSRQYQTNRVNMHISRIRAKARQTGVELPLKSVSSRGYMLLHCAQATKSP